MSGILGLNTGRIAIALGTTAVGALIGGAVAEHNDWDVAKGAVIGGASALAGLALLYGGAAAIKHFTAAKTGAAAGVSAIGTTLPKVPLATPMPSMASAAATTAVGTAATAAAPTTVASGWRSWASTLFREADTVATLRPLPVAVPPIASTALLPVAAPASGSTFLSAMARFLPG